jgi:hypothetical protein
MSGVADAACLTTQGLHHATCPGCPAMRAGAGSYASSQTFSRNMQNVGCMAMPFTCGAVWW